METIQQVALLDFHPLVGWRLRAVTQSKFEKINVVRIGKLKLLRLPVLTDNYAIGTFCNPRKIFFKEEQRDRN